MANVDFSIIIPHYNTPTALLHLLSTIPNQTNIEILVIDDNSTLPIEDVKAYIQTRKNIFLYTNTSGTKGAGAARNIGLKLFTGNWVLFADADDYFVPTAFHIIEKHLNSNADMIYFTPTSMDLITGNISSRHVMYMELVQNFIKKPTLKNLTALKYGFCTPWSKLISKKIIVQNNIRFDQIMVSNDIMFITKCAYFSSNIKADDQTIYCVTRGANSLTTNNNEQKFDTRVNVLINRYRFLEDHLSKKEFKYAHIDRLALGKLVDCFIHNLGINKLLSILKLYKKYNIKWFDIGLLNPITLFHNAKIELRWWFDIKRHQ